MVKRKLTEEKLHRDSNCFLMLIISHGTADNFLLDREGNKTWNIESLVTEICDVQDLVGKPKLFFIEACRGKENNFTTQMSKFDNPNAPCGISLPRYQVLIDCNMHFILNDKETRCLCGICHCSRFRVFYLRRRISIPTGYTFIVPHNNIERKIWEF